MPFQFSLISISGFSKLYNDGVSSWPSDCAINNVCIIFIALSTEDKLEYQFYPVNGQQIQFRIKAPHDAHLAFTTGPFEGDPIWEVLLFLIFSN